MKTSELLNAVIKDLEDPHSELMQLAESNKHVFDVIATSCIQAASILKLAAEEVNLIEEAYPDVCDECGFDHESEPKEALDMHLELDKEKEDSYKKDGDLEDDYESCALCGHDHAYEPEEAMKIHSKLPKDVNEGERSLSLDEERLSPEEIDSIADLSLAFDESGDENLKKLASVLDDLLLTVSAPKNYINNKKAAEDAKIKKLRETYQSANEQLHELNKTSDALEDIKKSKMLEKNDVIQHGIMSSRGCPDHRSPMKRVGDDGAGGSIWQCPLDNKTYDFSNNIKLENGQTMGGGSVNGQMRMLDYPTSSSLFDSRQGRLNNH